MHSGYVKSEGCHLLFYGMIGKEVDCCICVRQLSVYVHHKLFVFMHYCQVKKVNGSLLFICRIEF